jgi:molybdopterin synthase sulfur carrier subunit
MKLLYFAWVRERVGKAEEMLDPPAGVATVGELMIHLAARDDGYASAFADPKIIRAAIDRAHVKHDAAIAGACEIAFFPPMTGG